MMDCKPIALSNSVELATQRIKTEPSDEIKIEDVDFNELFMDHGSNYQNGNEETTSAEIDGSGCVKRSIGVDIIREDAGPDEIFKEEPRFIDDYELQGTESMVDNEFGSELLKQFDRSLERHQEESHETMASEAKVREDDQIEKSHKKTTKHDRISSTKVKRQRHSKRGHPSNTLKPSRKSAPRKVHLENSTFECFLCKAALRTLGYLINHYNRLHGQKSFRCYICTRRFSVESSLDLHLRSHTEAMPFKCAICYRTFTNQANLRRHNTSCQPMDLKKQNAPESLHDLKKAFECYLCKCDASSLQGLKIHLAEHTGDNCRLPCNICRKMFSLQSELVQHMRIHTGTKPHECTICLKMFTCTRNLKRHMRLHTREHLFRCNHCAKEYTTKYARDAHERKHK